MVECLSNVNGVAFVGMRRMLGRMLHCASCRARPARTVHSVDLGKCKPWRGFFDVDEVTPVDDEGEPFLPGERICGNSDCVSPQHVEELW